MKNISKILRYNKLREAFGIRERIASGGSRGAATPSSVSLYKSLKTWVLGQKPLSTPNSCQKWWRKGSSSYVMALSWKIHKIYKMGHVGKMSGLAWSHVGMLTVKVVSVKQRTKVRFDLYTVRGVTLVIRDQRSYSLSGGQKPWRTNIHKKWVTFSYINLNVNTGLVLSLNAFSAYKNIIMLIRH